MAVAAYLIALALTLLSPCRALGEFLVSAEIIPFVRRPRGLWPDETRDPLRSSSQADDLVMDHADTAPCEILPIFAPYEDEAS